MVNTSLADRYPLWFDHNIGFVGSTDEKRAITQAIDAVLTRLTDNAAGERPVLTAGGDLNMADLGSAAGVLGCMVGEKLHAATGSRINYLGVDVNGHQEQAVRANVGGEAFGSVDFQTGSSDKLRKFKPDVVLASHVYYYPDNADPAQTHRSTTPSSPLDTVLRDTVSSMKHDGVAFMVHESSSGFDVVKRQYGKHMESSTTRKLDAMLMPSGSAAASALSFTSHIYFPHLTDAQWKRLQKAEHYDVSTDPYQDKTLLNARILAEFMVHQPLEDMDDKARAGYLSKLRQSVEKAPLVREGEFAQKFGPVHAVENTNQLIVRTHHKNRAAGEYVKKAVSGLNLALAA